MKQKESSLNLMEHLEVVPAFLLPIDLSIVHSDLIILMHEVGTRHGNTPNLWN